MRASHELDQAVLDQDSVRVARARVQRLVRAFETLRLASALKREAVQITLTLQPYAAVKTGSRDCEMTAVRDTRVASFCSFFSARSFSGAPLSRHGAHAI